MLLRRFLGPRKVEVKTSYSLAHLLNIKRSKSLAKSQWKAAFVVVVVVMLVSVQTICLHQRLYHQIGELAQSSQPIRSLLNRTKRTENELISTNAITYVSGGKQQQQRQQLDTSKARNRNMSSTIPSKKETIHRKNFESASITPPTAQPITYNRRKEPPKRKTKRKRKIVAKAATNNSNIQSNTSSIQVQPTDFIYDTSRWDAAPIVLEDFNLVFFTVAKVGCTVWKKLFRRMMGYKNWRKQTPQSMIPSHPRLNGLRYLHHYSLENATRIMTSPHYTRAIFVRDPKGRFLSAYLDKALRDGGQYITDSCCRGKDRSCAGEKDVTSISGFLQVVKTCDNDHWNPQAHRVDERFWPYINFVGHMETIAMDAQRLLERVGAWERFGKNDWGPYQNESIFRLHSAVHTTGAAGKLEQFITTRELEKQIDEFYADDYASPWLNLTKRSIPSLHNGDTNQVVIE